MLLVLVILVVGVIALGVYADKKVAAAQSPVPGWSDWLEAVFA